MIDKVRMALDEQETIINISPKQVDSMAKIYTTIPTEVKRLYRMHEKYPEDVHILHDDKYGTEFSVPVRWVTVRRPRTVSEETRKASAERLAALRQKG